MFSRLNFDVNEILQTAGYIFLGLSIFGAGYYFGGKVATAKQVEQLSYEESIQKIALEGVVQDSLGNNIPVTAAEPVLGVHWLPLNEAPVCPETHPLKGKFDSSVNVYYAPDHKSYARVKPHLCLSDEEFAQNEAGFVRKF